MMLEIVAALDECDADDGVRAVIFTGAGDRAYCAGADLGQGAATFDYDKRTDKQAILPDGMSASPIAEDGTIDWSHPLIRDSGGRVSLRIFDCKKPVLGAINGAAAGIGAPITPSLQPRLASAPPRPASLFPPP